MPNPQHDSTTPLVVVGSKTIALNRTTGAVLWEYKSDEDVWRFLIVGDRLYLLDVSGDLHCLDLMTGNVHGVVSTGARGAHALVGDGNRLYIAASRGVILAHDYAGREIWRNKVDVKMECGLVGLGIPGAIQQPDYSKE